MSVFAQFTHYPATRGPRTGPKYTPAANKLAAIPRALAENMSAKTPALIVIEDEAKTLARNREARRVDMFFAAPCPAWRTVYATMVARNTGLRPMSSLPGPHKSG